MTAHYHGGVPGLAVGDWLEPPDVSGTTTTLSAHVPADAPHGARTDVVYVTPVQDVARVYAALYPDGALYRVEPVDPVGPDPDAPSVSSMVRRARVLEVVRPRVVYHHRTLDAWILMLTRAAERAAP